MDLNGAQSVTPAGTVALTGVAPAVVGTPGTAAFTGTNVNLPGIVNSNNWYPRLRHMWGQVQTNNGWMFLGGQTWFLGTLDRKLINPLTIWYPVGDDNATIPGFSEPNR